jgi:hypothetical protein
VHDPIANRAHLGETFSVRRLVQVLAVALLASVLVGPGQAAKMRLFTFKVSMVQEQTVRHHKASDGPDHSNDTFSTTLKLMPIGTVVGFPDKTPKATMGFEWGPLKGNCSSFVPRCDGTTNVNTFTSLPGGTLTAGGKHVSVSNGIILAVKVGTGIFKGAKGTIDIAPASAHEAVFTLTLPA